MFKPKIPLHIALPFHTMEDLRMKIMWHINLRWLAIFVVLAAVPVAREMLNYNISYDEIIAVASIMIIVNIIFFFLYSFLPVKGEIYELASSEMQIVYDLVILSFLIHYAGGIENPFFILYLVPTILSGILFPGAFLPFLNATLSAVILTLWTVGEFSGFIDQIRLYEYPVSISHMIATLTAFYITNFVGIYIINNFMMRYRSLKSVIDRKNELLEKAMEDRNKAFRFAAHELKAPVTAIKSTLDVVLGLYEKNLNADIKNMLDRADTRAVQVLNMVKEMIVITQYNLGLDKTAPERVEFVSWLRQNVELQNSYARDKGIDLHFREIRKTKPVEIDKTGMETVVSNLVNNALRYTMEGGKVTVEPFIKSESFGFSVTDTGIGIDEKDIDKIFNEFYRSKQARQMEHIGTGLGLNMVKEIIKKIGGFIRVNSKPGEGSTFTITIPYEPEEQIEDVHEEQEIRKLYIFE